MIRKNAAPADIADQLWLPLKNYVLKN